MDVKCFPAAILSAVILLSACASASPPTASKAETPRDGLSARQLADGECGLFVWTAEPSRRFILFGQSQNASAIWATDSGEVRLRAARQIGTPTQGQYPKQDFESEAAHTLALDLREAQAIENGTRYRAGTLTQTTAEGWNRVTPVVGLSACKPANTAS